LTKSYPACSVTDQLPASVMAVLLLPEASLAKTMLRPACKISDPLLCNVLPLKSQTVPLARVMSYFACKVICDKPVKAELTSR
jgi:hypothetical protein